MLLWLVEYCEHISLRLTNLIKHFKLICPRAVSQVVYSVQNITALNILHSMVGFEELNIIYNKD